MRLRQFLLRVEKRKTASRDDSKPGVRLAGPCHDSFVIRYSEETGPKTAFILPHVATCPDCLRETLDPRNRRITAIPLPAH